MTANPETSGTGVSRTLVLPLIIGAIGLICLGLQPLLYGAYVREAALRGEQIGLLGAVEVLAIAVASTLAIASLRRLPVRWIGAAGLLILLAGNMLPLASHGGAWVMAGRMLCGSGSGLLTGIAAAAIARSSRVGAWTAAFLFAQALAQFTVVQWFAAFHPDAASLEIQRAIAIVAAAGLSLLPFLPRVLAPLVQDEAGSGYRLAHPATLGLLGTMLFTGAAVGIWAYAGVWLASRGVPADAATQLLGFSLAGQMLGAILAALIADGRWPALRFLACLAALLAVAAAWYATPSSSGASFLFGLCWMGTAPIFAALLLDADPGRRAVAYLAPAQLLGIAFVPTLIGLSLGEADLDVLMRAFALALFASAVAAIPAGLTMRRRTAAPRDA